MLQACPAILSCPVPQPSPQIALPLILVGFGLTFQRGCSIGRVQRESEAGFGISWVPQNHLHLCVCFQPERMSILLEGTWISHPYPTDGLCDVFSGKANLSLKFQFIPEKKCLLPFLSLAFGLSMKKWILLLLPSPLKGKTMSP